MKKFLTIYFLIIAVLSGVMSIALSVITNFDLKIYYYFVSFLILFNLFFLLRFYYELKQRSVTHTNTMIKLVTSRSLIHIIMFIVKSLYQSPDIILKGKEDLLENPVTNQLCYDIVVNLGEYMLVGTSKSAQDPWKSYNLIKSDEKFFFNSFINPQSDNDILVVFKRERKIALFKWNKSRIKLTIITDQKKLDLMWTGTKRSEIDDHRRFCERWEESRIKINKKEYTELIKQ